MKKFTSLMMVLLCAITTSWAAATDLPTLTTDAENPVWYLIKNVRRNKYATYAGDDATMTQQETATAGAFFYFTGSITDGVATVKIHNYVAGDKLCAAYNSWTTEGIDWYIKAQATGISICTSTGDWDAWNDAGGGGQKVEYWSASDAGSAWEVELVTDFSSVINVPAAKEAAVTELQNLASVSVIYPAATEAIANVNAVAATGTSIAELNAAIDAVNAIVAEYKTNAYKALNGKYFSINTPGRANGGYLTMSDAKVIGTASLTTINSIWQFIENNGKVYIYNPYTGKYLGEPGNNSTVVPVTKNQADAALYDLVVNASASNAAAKIKLTSNTKSVHVDGSLNLVRWDNGGASEYTVSEITDFTSLISTHKTNTIATLDGWATLSVVFDASLIANAKAAVSAVETTGYDAFAEIDSKLTDVTNAVATKMFTFQTTATDDGRNGVWVSANASTAKAIGADAQDYNAIWSLRHAGGTSFYLFNELNQVYMGAPSSNCPLTAEPVSAYTFEIVDATQNIVEMKCGGETLHASNHADNKLLNYDQDEAASRWYINTIDVASDIQDILDTITEDDYAEVPALGQYPTTAYNALVEARTSATTVEAVEAAIAAFKASKNVPVYFITSVATSAASYATGKAILYNGSAWRFETANKYNKQMWMTIPSYTEENVPTVDSYDAANTYYEICDYLTGTVMRGKKVQIVKIENWDGAYNLQYGTATNDAVQHAQNGGALVGWNPATTTDCPASAWNVEYIGNSYDLDKLTDEKIAALAALQTAYNSKAYYKNATIGTALGEYTGDNATLNSALENAESIASKTLAEQAGLSTDDITSAATAINNATVPTLNMPAAGTYIRIKSVAEWEAEKTYLSSANSTAETGRAAFVADADASTIFYVDGTQLVSYASGNYLVNNSNFLGYNGVQTAGTSIAFEAASDNLTGAYNIIFNGNRKLYTNQNGYTDAAGSGVSGLGYDFNLEEVTELPVTITAAGYATFYAPVDVTYDGIEAYYTTGEVKDEKYLQLVDFEGTIPATDGAILKGNEGTYYLTIISGAEKKENNNLTGSIATTVIPKEAANSYYVLGRDTNGNVGLYNPINGENTDVFTNTGHKAYMLKEGAAQTIGYSLGFDWNGTTGIENIEDAVEENATKAIYDITGRQIKAITVPGIYIINGKKTFVK